VIQIVPVRYAAKPAQLHDDDKDLVSRTLNAAAAYWVRASALR
jgi:hypothetical protein